MWPCLRCLDVHWTDGLAGSRPGGRGTFLCFAKEKYPKERRAGCVVPALRAGHAALLGPGGRSANSPCGLRHASLFFRPLLRYSPPHTAVGTRKPKNNTEDTQACGFAVSGIHLPCVCAEARRPGRITGCACLSPQGEFAQTPARSSTAGCPGPAGVTDTRVAFLLVPFLWRDKEKELRRRAHIPARPPNQLKRKPALTPRRAPAPAGCQSARTRWSGWRRPGS